MKDLTWQDLLEGHKQTVIRLDSAIETIEGLEKDSFITKRMANSVIRTLQAEKIMKLDAIKYCEEKTTPSL